jgi:hypothetical protein
MGFIAQLGQWGTPEHEKVYQIMSRLLLRGDRVSIGFAGSKPGSQGPVHHGQRKNRQRDSRRHNEVARKRAAGPNIRNHIDPLRGSVPASSSLEADSS